MRRLDLLGAVLVTVLLAACGGDETTKNNTANNTIANNTSANNTTPNNMDACDGVSCAALDPTCVGQIALTHSGAGACVAATGACDYDAVETRTDCTSTGQNCMAGACIDMGDLCANVACDTMTPPSACDMDTAVSYGAGTCAPATGLCDYTETREDCAAAGQACSVGVCANAGPQPNPGDVVVTEYMSNPAAVPDDAGEWLELFNASTRELDLQGLTLSDDGGESFALGSGTPVLLAAGGYFVVGNNPDVATNGGVTLDMSYGADMSLANGSDEIVITDGNAVEIDRIAWDTDAGWPSLNGSSAQFGSDFSLATDDNNDAQFWCGSTVAFGDGDFGTPGGPNGTCAPVVATLYEISNEADANHPTLNAMVEVSGVTVTALSGDFMWLQETAGGQYSGVYVDAGAVDVTALAVGDVVDIVGTYDELFDLARISATAITDTGMDRVVMPEVLETSVLADAVMAETWESVLVQIVEAGVTDIDLGNGEILIDSNIIVNDLLFAGTASATECQVYDSITGPLNYSFGAFKIEPRDAADFGTPVDATLTTSVDVSNFDFNPNAICITAGDTVTWTNADGVGHTATSRLPSQPRSANANIPATPLFDELLAAGGSASVVFANGGSFHYRCRPHSNMEGVVVVPDP